MKKILVLLLIVCWIGFGCNSNKNSDVLTFMDVGSSLPSTNPDEWLMAFVDVETTGLIPGYHEMIDIGMVITDLEGNVIDSMFCLVQPEHPERLSEGAYAVNAFDPQLWNSRGALSSKAAVDSIMSFHNRVADGRYVLLTAFNSQFDTAFMDHLFRSCDHSWRELFHYMVLDVPSMAWGLGFRDIRPYTLMEKYNVTDEPHVAKDHTGITGAMLNVRIYQAIIYHLEHIH